MSSTDDALERTRPFLAQLVEREKRRSGSRMTAYEHVAFQTGMSGSWIRKVLGRQPGVAVGHAAFLRIALAYTRLCERIEAETVHELALANKLREAADAALACNHEPMGRVARASTPDPAAARRAAGTPNDLRFAIDSRSKK